MLVPFHPEEQLNPIQYSSRPENIYTNCNINFFTKQKNKLQVEEMFMKKQCSLLWDKKQRPQDVFWKKFSLESWKL